MQVIKPGDNRPRGWSLEIRCSGSGNGGGGCHAQLLIGPDDLFHSYSSAMGRDETHFHTFMCSECGVWTDVPDVRIPGWLQRDVQALKISVPGKKPFTIGDAKLAADA